MLPLTASLQSTLYQKYSCFGVIDHYFVIWKKPVDAKDISNYGCLASSFMNSLIFELAVVGDSIVQDLNSLEVVNMF